MLPAMGFLWVALYALVHGSGRFSLDYFITTKLTQNANSLGKNNIQNTRENNSKNPILATIFLFLLLLANTNTAFAQSRPLRGSGNIITKAYDFKDFDKVELADLDGKTTIEIGKTFAIKIEIDDNLLPILKVENRNGKLLIAFDKNENNRRYIEDTGLRIHITMPEISVLEHHGNSGVVVNGIVGRYFSIENDGNGGATLNGTIDKLDIKQRGNGSVQAKNLTAKFVSVNAAGNGSVKVNASVSLSAKGKGNGSIINTGNGKIEPLSGVIGNGEVHSE
jgi:Putative auto-transporter adhesin, head GIN domain